MPRRNSKLVTRAKSATRSALKTYGKVTGTIGKYTTGLPEMILGKAVGMKNIRRRRKLNPAEDAAALYESFHGKPATGVMEVAEDLHIHKHLPALGVLTELSCVLTVGDQSGKELDLEFSDGAEEFDETVADPNATYLCASEDGRQLYFVGGDQGLELDELGIGEEWVKDDMVLGVLIEVVYRTKKKFDQFQLVDYYHELGEETGDMPLLRYAPRSPHLYVTGGKYEIKMPLIGMSPGIEN